MLYVAVIAGAVIALLFGLNEALAKSEFKTAVFLRQNLGSTLLNIICGCVLVFAKEDITTIYPITFISAVLLGMSGQFVFKKVAKIFDNSSETLLGFNKDKDKPIDKQH
jgi:O-antigen/teichoic acid export membrane protein